jgi:hypothetical protein
MDLPHFGQGISVSVGLLLRIPLASSDEAISS